MNPLLSRVLGNSEPQDESNSESVAEDSGVPVPCAVMPRKSFRDRLEQNRHKERGTVRRVMGEAAEGANDSLIPQNAEEIEASGEPIKKGIKPVKDTVLEPRDPYAEKEKLMTPQAALVAPDVTPDADKPLDPAMVPGTRSASFKTQDAEREEAPARNDEPLGNRALEILLGRSKPPTEMNPDAMPTTEAAYHMMGIQSPQSQHLHEDAPSGQVLLNEALPMPDHVHSDGRRVLSVFRKFNG